jgi:hypothetical protein
MLMVTVFTVSPILCSKVSVVVLLRKKKIIVRIKPVASCSIKAARKAQ